MDDNNAPKTRKETKKDQSSKASGVNGGYTSKHVRINERKGSKMNQHANKASRKGDVDHSLLSPD